jgi:hypothetical protein
MGWIHFIQDSNHCWALVSVVMGCQVLYKAGNYQCGFIYFSPSDFISPYLYFNALCICIRFGVYIWPKRYMNIGIVMKFFE